MAGQPAKSLNEQVQHSTMGSIESLYEESLRSLASQIRDTRSSLREASRRLPDSKESRDRLREMQRTFEELEETLQRSGAEIGVKTGLRTPKSPTYSRPAAGCWGRPPTRRASSCSAS